jgi:hypothetical protein
MAGGMSNRDIGDQVIVTPAADAGRIVGGDVEGTPAGGQRACKSLAIVQRKREVSRRVAFSTMGQTSRASVPTWFWTSLAARLDASVSVSMLPTDVSR